MPYRMPAEGQGPDNELTACNKCIHFLNKGDSWHSHFCKACPTPLSFQYKTGEMALGKYEDEYQCCKNINIDGHCRYFVEKKGVRR
jgi:hypothetical protein